MGKIFCLMGKSSSGKDTIFREIKEDKNLGLLPIIGYTTRPKRTDETNGVEYYFIDNNTLSGYRECGKLIEERVYNTVSGDWHYCTLDDGQIDLSKNYILITTLESYNSLKAYFGEEYVVPFYIKVDDGIRLERALIREMKQENPNYDELCRRFLADSVDFSEENLSKLGIKKSYSNYDLDKCIDKIKKEILNLI
ncbi:guanylate kinase [Clostridium cylindrosporum]|uniref:Guanylate kinase n=1 Tax=Clostridium cylindrosporum DSM 605 TaxID=1121307 RepID=A0A0J8DFC0_CLOCY|nr:guanylate kinase [Clostridium cylindrosporum]KMT22949.1 guanylate kinase [Clostridium cylindrosporum DSM 605]